MKKRSPDTWPLLTAGLTARGWSFQETTPGASLVIPCPPDAYEHPARKEMFSCHIQIEAPPQISIRSTWSGEGTPARWVELAAFVATVAPRLGKGDLTVDTTRGTVSFQTAHKWTAKGGYDGFENAMVENMTRMTRIVDHLAAVLSGEPAAGALASVEEDESDRL